VKGKKSILLRLILIVASSILLTFASGLHSYEYKPMSVDVPIVGRGVNYGFPFPWFALYEEWVDGDYFSLSIFSWVGFVLNLLFYFLIIGVGYSLAMQWKKRKVKLY